MSGTARPAAEKVAHDMPTVSCNTEVATPHATPQKSLNRVVMSIRLERLGEVLKRDLGEILQQNYQLSGTFITVTQVRLTPDLSIAKVYVSVFAPDRDPDTVFQHIDDHTAEIRYELASRIRHQVRRIPELHFYVDDSAAYVNRMEELFQKVREDRKQSNASSSSDDASGKAPDSPSEDRNELS